LFVPIDGSTVSRLAAEFALRFAEATAADLTLAFVAERRAAPVDPDQNPDDLPERGRPSLAEGAPLSWRPPASDPPPADRLSRVSELPSDSVEYLARISPAFRVSGVKPNIVHLDYDPSHSATAAAIVAGRYDIVVLGAENRAVRKRLFFGYENQRIIDLQSVTTLILVPNFARIH
jgi:nucleotide-binding universal stress UspA family protein